MIPIDVAWLFAFLLLLVVMNVLCFLLTRYVDDKPTGHQSLYDVVFSDTINVIQLYGTTYCILAIVSRNECNYFLLFQSSCGKIEQFNICLFASLGSLLNGTA